MPVNYDYRGLLLKHIVEHSDARAMVVSPDRIERLADENVGFANLERLVVVGDGAVGDNLPVPVSVFADLEIGGDDLPGVALRHDDIAAIMYSSGTTGPSKGILVSHNYFWWHGRTGAEGRGVNENERLYTCLPLFHANAQLVTTCPVLLGGGTLILDGRFHASTFWERLRTFGATQLNYIGGMIPMLLKQPATDADRAHSVRIASGGGAPRGAWTAFDERFGVTISEGYGQTENCYALSSPLDAPRVGSMGLPTDSYDIDLVDENDEPVGPDVIGEMVFRPRYPHIMMEGYYKNPEASWAQSTNMWFHTGDLMTRYTDGYYYFVDRKKDAIRRRGENISAFEVEMVVNAHPAVLESAAIAVPSELGEDEVMICLIPRPDMTLDPADLLAHCVKLMPYFSVPRYIDIRDELPKTPTHRVEKYKLRANGITPTTWDREAAGLQVTR